MNFWFPIPSGTSGIQSHWGQRHTPVRGSYSQVSASNFSYDKLFHCFFGLAQARYVVGDEGRRQNARRMFCPGSFPIDDNDDDYMRPFGLVGSVLGFYMRNAAEKFHHIFSSHARWLGIWWRIIWYRMQIFIKQPQGWCGGSLTANLRISHRICFKVNTQSCSWLVGIACVKRDKIT